MPRSPSGWPSGSASAWWTPTPRSSARPAGRVGDVLVDDGEDAFRALERAAAARRCARTGVVALGGGAVLDADVRDALAGSVPAGAAVVFLDVTLAHAVPPAGVQPAPPAAAGQPAGACGRR